ncbi:hypothetical protein MYOV056v2_p0124 [Vibrio phage 184E37.3a]|nr:hypothetical protein MYOV056v2_p0124 [Vibrio phage 184E37.3a]QZI89930.1 hypothetical protein MYOV057v1_p0015 [Vibrio phage 184E37.1]
MFWFNSSHLVCAGVACKPSTIKPDIRKINIARMNLFDIVLCPLVVV